MSIQKQNDRKYFFQIAFCILFLKLLTLIPNIGSFKVISKWFHSRRWVIPLNHYWYRTLVSKYEVILHPPRHHIKEGRNKQTIYHIDFHAEFIFMFFLSQHLKIRRYKALDILFKNKQETSGRPSYDTCDCFYYAHNHMLCNPQR
jgi:5-methylcytosine-specific restriction endonuclease McrBC regulatory subunit McrC